MQVHHKITVGVWYRTFDGGPRVYRLEVIDPDGRVIFTRHGKAPETWKLWHVRLDEIGVTKTVYRVKDADGDWVRRALRTRVVRG